MHTYAVAQYLHITHTSSGSRASPPALDPKQICLAKRQGGHVSYVCVYYLCMYASKPCVHVCLCMYVCMYVFMYVYVCMYVCMCSCMSMCVCMHVCMYVFVYVYVCMRVCFYVHAINVCIETDMSGWSCMLCVCVLCMHVCMYRVVPNLRKCHLLRSVRK
jgi:hypothetical protein